MAKTYAALAVLCREPIAELLAHITLKTLALQYAGLLYHYGAALNTAGDRAVVPGGEAAIKGWENLAGAPAADPGRFFQALIQKDGGALLAFFSSMGELDGGRQRFFNSQCGTACHGVRLVSRVGGREVGLGRRVRATVPGIPARNSAG